MSFASFIAILLICQLVLTAQKSCSSIKPDSSSDCVLSSSDKDKGYVYCCYEALGGIEECSAYTEEQYQEEKEAAELFGDAATMICSTTVGARFMNSSIKTLILLILLNL